VAVVGGLGLLHVENFLSINQWGGTLLNLCVSWIFVGSECAFVINGLESSRATCSWDECCYVQLG
jgi:hypothetical protein